VYYLYTSGLWSRRICTIIIVFLKGFDMKKLIIFSTVMAFVMPSFGLLPCHLNPECTVVPADGCEVVIKHGRDGPYYAQSCTPSARSNSNNTAVALAVVGGIVFVGVMWYLFSTPASKNISGQVQLMEF
jgi:Mn2+/Fe2+ NRAMP family transporter